MSFKKTLTVSIVFHLIMLSAALLFSAGLFKGSGNQNHEKVFFVKLTADDRSLENSVTAPDRKQFVSGKRQKLKAKQSIPPVAEKLPVQVTPEPVPEEVQALPDKEAYEIKDNYDHDKEELHSETLHEGVKDFSEITGPSQETVQTSMISTVSKPIGLKSGTAGADLTPFLIERIGSAIERAKSYPMLARKRGLEGTVHISFRVNEKGRPDEIEIKKSSGHRILDSATVKVVKKAAPYPAVSNRIEVPVAYRLSK